LQNVQISATGGIITPPGSAFAAPAVSLNILVTVVNKTGTPTTAGGVGVGTIIAGVITNPLVYGGAANNATFNNLLWNLSPSFTQSPFSLIAITVTIATGFSSTISENVIVTGHNLQLRDVSVPVLDYTDLRNNAVGVAAGITTLNPWDVAVIQPGNYGLQLDGTGNPVLRGNIQLNGQDRFDQVLGQYFNYVQPYQHHTHTPVDGVNVYSFGLHPEQHQPSGTCNLSRIDSTILNLIFSDPFRNGVVCPTLNFVLDTKFYVFTQNYNVLRIMSGMGGLAYSN